MSSRLAIRLLSLAAAEAKDTALFFFFGVDFELLTATERTVRWAERSRRTASRPDQTLFAIVQGGLDAELRIDCARRLADMEFSGYAIGGLSVGEAPADMYRVVVVTCPALPTDRPRYLMGVGRPLDLLEAISRGVDLFDCMIPTRNGRNAFAFTDDGPLTFQTLAGVQVGMRDEEINASGATCP